MSQQKIECYTLKPLGIQNKGTECWLISLFQCLYWTPFFRQLLIEYLPLTKCPTYQTNKFKEIKFNSALWRIVIARYKEYVEAISQGDTIKTFAEELSHGCMPHFIFDPQRLAQTLFPENYTIKRTNQDKIKEVFYRNQQQDASEGLLRLMSYLPDRERLYCEQHKTDNTIILKLFYSNTADEPEDKKCITCHKLDPIDHYNLCENALYGFPINKYILGRTLHYLTPDTTIPLKKDTSREYTRFDTLNNNNINDPYILSEYYFPVDNDNTAQVIIPLPKTNTILSFKYLLKRYILEEFSFENRLPWKGIDKNDNVRSFYVIGKKKELLISPDLNEPPISMIISFNRFAWTEKIGAIKINTPISIPLDTINFKHLFCPSQSIVKECSTDKFDYQLSSFIVHIGNSTNGGHYISYVSVSSGCEEQQQQQPKKWYLCNDESVSEIQEIDLKEALPLAYMCFFTRVFSC